MEKTSRVLLIETLAVYAAAIGFIVLAKLFNRPNIEGIVIILVFLVAPYLIIEKSKRDLDEYGLGRYSLKRNLLIGLGTTAVLLPLFAGAYIGLHYLLPEMLAWCGVSCKWISWLDLPLITLGGLKALGWGTIVKAFVMGLAMNILFTGIVEEVFYRCYMQGNLNRVWARRWTVKGIRFGPALIITAVLFAVVHPIWWGSPLGILVFFPGLLFGILREWSGSFVAPAVFHGFCNVTIFFLNGALFRQ